MRFLKSLFRSAKEEIAQHREQEPKTKKDRSLVNRQQDAHPEKHHAYSITLEGECERTVYTYDGSPLNGTRKGSVIYADVVTKHTRLHSNATGTDWDSTDGGVALAVNGVPFGMTNTLAETFKELDRAGYAVKVKLKRVGLYCKGIPEMVMMIPQPEEVFRWRNACRALGREVPFSDRHTDECERAADLENKRRRLSRLSGLNLPIGVDGDVFFIKNDDWPGAKPHTRCEPVEISTELIPLRKGSKAKPHIAVRVSGEIFTELSARNRQYQTIAKHVGDKPYAATCQRRTLNDGTNGWQIVVVYLSMEDE